MTMHQISDLEYLKLNRILDAFSRDSVLLDYNDDYVYILDGEKAYRLDRSKVSPNITVEEAVKLIESFE